MIIGPIYPRQVMSNQLALLQDRIFPVILRGIPLYQFGSTGIHDAINLATCFLLLHYYSYRDLLDQWQLWKERLLILINS